MKQPKGTMSKSLVDKIIMQAMIDSLLNDTREEFHQFDPYSLTPIREKLHFKNGEASLPSATKETKSLKSILESGQYVSEVPIMKVKGNKLELLGPFGYADDEKIPVELPDLNKTWYLNAGRLKRIFSQYVTRVYEDTDKEGWTTYYVLVTIDRKRLFDSGGEE
jgi:hypothetical protein